MKVIDEQLLNEVSRQAKESPRLRMNYNFHPSLDERGLWMFCSFVFVPQRRQKV